MFVTSDIFDLEHIARIRRHRWGENLVCGVAAYGPNWPGAGVAAEFLMEAASRSGLAGEMEYAGYKGLDDKRIRSVAPASLGRIARGEMPAASAAMCLLLRGELPAPTAKQGATVVGGEVAWLRRAKPDQLGLSRPFLAYFLCPLSNWSSALGESLLELAVGLLDCQYGFSYVRDELCFPTGYGCGLSGSLGFDDPVKDDAEELWQWGMYARAELWERSPPVFRDLFEINLVPEAYRTAQVAGLGRLPDWIDAGPARGRLKDAGKGRLLWILSDAEIATARPVLNAAGLLFSCPPRVYRDLPGFGRR